MRNLEWFESSYTPKSCNVTLDGAFVKAGSGNQMRTLYHAATDRQLMIVGGDSATVSLGGYISGGGHSVLSPWLGMAADQIVEIEMVTADGNLIVANECSNPDVFWAARGVCTPVYQSCHGYANKKLRGAALRSASPHLSSSKPTLQCQCPCGMATYLETQVQMQIGTLYPLYTLNGRSDLHHFTLVATSSGPDFT